MAKRPTPTPTPPEQIRHMLEVQVASWRIRRERERAYEPEFSSVNLPPRTSRRTFAEWCHAGRVADARIEGKVWICRQRAWFEARSRKPSIAKTAPVADLSVENTLRAHGFVRKVG